MKDTTPEDPSVEGKPPTTAFCVLLAAALFTFIKTFTLLEPILLSFLLILLISFAVNPLIVRVRALTGGRKKATGLIAVFFIAVLALTGLAVSGPMKASVSRLSEQLPGYWERLQKPLIKMEKQSALSEQKLQAEVTTEMAEATRAADGLNAVRPSAAPVLSQVLKETGSLRYSLSQILKDVAGSFTAVAVDAAQILIVLVTVFIGVIFMLMNPCPVIGFLFALTPERHHKQTLSTVQRIAEFVPRWALATLLGMVTIGLLVFFLMLPIFGFMDALVLGLIACLLEAVPYLGPILSAVPALLFAVAKGGMTPGLVILAYLAVQALENNVTTPLIMARSLKLHPVAVLFPMLICVAAFGVLGVLVAAPLVAILDILHDELYRKRHLPTVTDANLDRLARLALHEKQSGSK